MRKDNWRVNLFEYFKEVKRNEFDQDKFNCAHFIANGWLHLREDDPFLPFRKYKNFQTLFKAVKKLGYENYVNFYSTFLNEYEHVSQGRVGDIAVFRLSDLGLDEVLTNYVSGFVIGDLVFVQRENGLATLRLNKAWKVFEV